MTSRFLVEARFGKAGGHSEDNWTERVECETEEEARNRAGVFALCDECYCVEIWRYVGCTHAVG